MEEALGLFSAQVRVKGLDAAYLVAPEIPPDLMGDALRLRQILVNLIGNAVKFTTQGEVTVEVELAARKGDVYELRFAVTDSGIGIPKESIDKLFRAFQQVDTSTTRRYGGTGLGLVICKRLTELMQGRMWVESTPGVGSTFFFTVPLKAAFEPAPDYPLPDTALLTSFSALIVDDNATNRRVLEQRLKQWGMGVISAASGPEALERMECHPFTVALLDLNMPGMDGVTLARKMRKKKAIPLILLSSSGEILTGRDATLFRDQVPKPIKHSQLYNALVRITGVTVPAKPKVQEMKLDANMAVTHPLRILLTEDNVVNQKVQLLMLSRLGYKADLAVNGLRAVEAAESGAYDVILMDIQMPEMNGVDATRIIREKSGRDGPKIFALTAEDLAGDNEKPEGVRFDGYLRKPLQASMLQGLLKTVEPRAKAPGQAFCLPL